MGITFYLENGFPRYRESEPRLMVLGMFLVMDVQTSPTLGYDLLDLVERAFTGQEDETEWDGEGFHVTFSRADGVKMRNNFLEDKHGTYGLDEVRGIAQDFWHFIASVAGPKQCAFELGLWEQTWGRAHPYRGRLF